MTTGLRKRRTRLFVQIPSDTIRDKRLSFRARGLLAYLLDMPDGWDVKSEFLASQGKEGREAVRTALHELGKHGYYRIERRQLLNGTFVMGTAISEDPVPEWADDYAEFQTKPVSVVQQQDESFKVRHKDGTLTDDGFEVAVDPNRGPDEDPGSGGTDPTEDGFSGPGSPGFGSPDSGSPDSGSLDAIREKEKRDTEAEELSSSSTADAADDQETDHDPTDTKNDREDVIGLCEHLRRRILENGTPENRVRITKAWLDAARLMLDRDGRDPQKAHHLIDWCQNDEFWKANILSMPKFRDQYDKLRLRAVEEWQAQRAGTRRAYDDVATWGEYDPEKTRQEVENFDIDAFFARGKAVGE